jgi:hypothetical protein
VIFSGICGMVLATIIRLEMAYPGVGILAGDSLQYLSVVTAHAVIMVFFMIMPLLFGAFGNFLLPTQLGVHDVAFPRLNSAAFWFLPAGLIMLCQLVCLDRRYQRMNCFNIREVQALLKARFFSDLINSNDHHNLLEQTALGIRFKTNNLDSINPNMLLLHKYGINHNFQARNQQYSLYYNTESSNNYLFLNMNVHTYSFIKSLDSSLVNYFLKKVLSFYSSTKELYFNSNFSYVYNITGFNNLINFDLNHFNYFFNGFLNQVKSYFDIINVNETLEF